MENLVVKIYVLVDPITLKVRYIGRTRLPLKERLQYHVGKVRHLCKTGKKLSHVHNWIKQCLDQGSNPIIRQIHEIIGWGESHIFEIALIDKYKARLVNLDDKGAGEAFKYISPETREQIKETLKLKRESGWRNDSCDKPIHVYLKDGTFYKSYTSLTSCSKELNIALSSIIRVTSGVYKECKNYRFRYEKVESLNPLNTVKGQKFHLNLIDTVDNTEQLFYTVRECLHFLDIKPFNMGMPKLEERLSAKKYNGRYKVQKVYQYIKTLH